MTAATKVHHYLSLVKFSHTVFAMPFALIGFFLGYQKVGKFNPWIFVMVLICMVLARNTAMSFNRLVDRKYDAKNKRTQGREIPQGIIKPRAARIFVIANAVMFIFTAFYINRLVFYLSPVALFVVLFYSYTKRFTALCHFALGIGLALAPLGAYLAATGQFDLLPAMFAIIVMFWSSGFDIIYSLQDEDFDRQQGLHSIPAAVGRKKALIIANLLHTVVAATVIFVGFYFNMGLFYWIGSGLFIIMLVYQHVIVTPTDISRVNLAFATTNGLASLTFAAFNILDLIF